MEAIDRKALVKLSIKRLQSQVKEIETDIVRDCTFIEDKTAILPHLTFSGEAKRNVEKQIAERMIRVDNLRTTLQMIALTVELLEQEWQKLGMEVK